MRRIWISAISILFATHIPAQACELKLLLSWDVSASMSDREYGIQRSGTADAFRNPRVKNAIALSDGGIEVALMQWAGPDQQLISVPWTRLRSGTQAAAFAEFVDATERQFPERKGTAIGNSLERARAYLTHASSDCKRSVIDVSGDGISNVGIDTALQADGLAYGGTTINGLVMPSDFKSGDPYMYYVRNVARGHGAFVMDVTSYEDFPRAFQRKLLREIVLQFAEASP